MVEVNRFDARARPAPSKVRITAFCLLHLCLSVLSQKVDASSYYGREGQHAIAAQASEGDLQVLTAVRRQAAVCIFGTADGEEIQVSGVAVSHNGLILTTAHDVASADRLKIRRADGTVGWGSVLISDPRYDLAVLTTNIPIAEYVPIVEDATLPPRGTRLWAVGCPFGAAGRPSAGRVTAPPRPLEETLSLQTDLPSYPGSSGSPVFDSEGRLVGLVKGRLRGLPQVSFLVPAFYAGPLLAESTNVNPEKPMRPPDTAAAWLNRALATRDRGEKEEALLQVLRLGPESVTVLYHLGMVYGTWPEKNVPERQTWTRLVELQPEWGEVYFRLGNCHSRAGRLEDAERMYRKAVQLIGEDPRIFNNLGEALRRSGRLGDAERTLLKALALDPDYSQAHFNLGILYDRHLKRPERALEHFRRYLELEPEAPEAGQVRAWMRQTKQKRY